MTLAEVVALCEAKRLLGRITSIRVGEVELHMMTAAQADMSEREAKAPPRRLPTTLSEAFEAAGVSTKDRLFVEEPKAD